MTSHLVRMQYQQQQHKLDSLRRAGSSSSLRSGDHSQFSYLQSGRPDERLQSIEAGSSILSGSIVSPPRSQQNYENINNGLQTQSSIISRSLVGSGSNSGAQPMGSQITRTASVASYQASTTLGKSTRGQHSIYVPSQLRMSRSLKASKASLATYKSGRTTIQAEHHDRNVRRRLNSVKFGRARRLYWIAVAFFIMFLVVLFVGLLIMCLRHIYMNIILSLDVGEMTGPLLIACSFIFFGIGMKFYADAYRVGAQERMLLKYKPASSSTVTVTTVSKRVDDPEEKLVSGQTSENALSRAPIGSRTNLLVP